MTWGEIIVATAVIFVMGVLIYGGIQRLNSDEVEEVRQRTEQAAYDALQSAYFADLRAYDAAVVARALCIDGVERSGANREQWTQLADIIQTFDNGSGRAVDLANQIRTGPVLSVPPRQIGECPTLPPQPKPPVRPEFG